MYGFFLLELIHLIALTRLAALLFPPVFVRRLPRPTSAADLSVTGFRLASGTIQRSDH